MATVSIVCCFQDYSGSNTGPSCSHSSHRKPVFDAYSQGFHFPRCEDAWAEVQAGNRQTWGSSRGGGTHLPAMPRAKPTRATSPGALIGSTTEWGSEYQHPAPRQRRQWFDSQDHRKQMHSDNNPQPCPEAVSHPYSQHFQMTAAAQQQPTQGGEEEAWRNRMQAVRARLAALRGQLSAQAHGNATAHQTAGAGPTHQSDYNTCQWEDWGPASDAATPPRSVGRRPVGPGDAFQGQSLNEVLSSGRSRAPEPSTKQQDAERGSGEAGPSEDRTRARRHGQNDSAMEAALDSFGGMSLGELMPARRVQGRDRPSVVSGSRLQQRRAAQRTGSVTAADLQPQPYRGGASQEPGGDAWLISAGQNGRSTDFVEDAASGASPHHGLGALTLLHRFTHTAGECDGSAQVDTDDVQECSICLDVFAHRQVLRKYRPCGHTFHERCIVEWLARGVPRCPYCRGHP